MSRVRRGPFGFFMNEVNTMQEDLARLVTGCLRTRLPLWRPVRT